MSHHERSFSVDAEFPGGNIGVNEIAGQAVSLHQELRDTDAWWFYWYFRVRGAQGRTLTFDFTLGDVIGPRGPAVSLDAGHSWNWLGTEAVEETSFTYTFPADAAEVRFAFAIPYVASDLDDFLATHKHHPGLATEVLCHTRKGRSVRALRLGMNGDHAPFRTLLTSRHHACESIASYVLEGLMTAALADTPLGHWLQANVAFFVVPFMDKDGVEEGDQGKQRYPRDHNRDYDGTSLYATTRTLRERMPRWFQVRQGLALDLHCPYIRGDHSTVVYCVGGPDRSNWASVQRFSGVLEEVQRGPLIYQREDNLAYGEGWNTPENTAQGKSFSRWAAELPGVQMATTIETPYAEVRGTTVTADAARALGWDIARALRHYLAEAT